MPTWDSLWTNVNLATMAAGGAPYRAIENGALAIKGGRSPGSARRPDCRTAMPARWSTAGAAG